MEYYDICVELNNVLRHYKKKLKLSKKFGQYLMCGCRLARDFANVLHKLALKKVLEIGTGIGSLTLILSRYVDHVITVEIDPKLAFIAKEVLKDRFNVEIILGDGISFLSTSSIRVNALCSNPPFNLTGPLLSAIVKSNYEVALLTLQREVAEKLESLPGSRRSGRLSAFVRTFMDVNVISTYPPSEFVPRPEVDISLVLLRRKRLWSQEWELYEDFIRCVFNQRRKIAYKVVKKCLEDVLKVKQLIYPEMSKLMSLRVFSLDPESLVEIFRMHR